MNYYILEETYIYTMNYTMNHVRDHITILNWKIIQTQRQLKRALRVQKWIVVEEDNK